MILWRSSRGLCQPSCLLTLKNQRKKEKGKTMQVTVERRYTRTTDPGGGIGANISGFANTMTGTAARFNVLSHPLDGFFERIQPGAFKNSLQSDRDCICNINHNNDRILGRRKNGTLKLNEDDRGLQFRCELPDTSDGRDIAALLKREDLSECSFAFTVDLDSWDNETDGDGRSMLVRTLRSVNLMDVAVVASPAYPGTSAGVNVACSPHVMGRSERDLFPEGMPIEMRSRILSVNPQNRAQLSRRRIFDMFIG
jgi:HK97 family phage prohead protease